MSEDVNPTMNNFDAVPAEDAVASQTAVMNPAFEPENFSVDQYAGQLMDELFRGVEHFLETGEELVVETPAEPAPARLGVAVETLELPEAAPLVVLESPTAETAPAAEPLTHDDPAGDRPEEAPTATQPDRALRFLWAAAILSGIGAIALLVTQWSSYKALFEQFTGQAVAPATTAGAAAELEVGFSAPNQAFANYVKQSLDTLAAQQEVTLANGATNGGAIAIPTGQQLPPVPPPPAAAPTIPGGLGTVAQATPGQPTTILERVYIPVYQTPQGLVPVVPGMSIPGLNAPADSPTVAVAPNQASASPSLPNLEASSAPGTAAIGSPSNNPTNPAPQPAPAVQHTLVGLLELGDSSAALFAINGVTRRFSLGERVGSSGWTLVNVKNSEALVRRNGEVRSIYVGQTF